MYLSISILAGLCLLTRATAIDKANSSDLAAGTSPIFTEVPPVKVADPYVIQAITQKLSLYDIAIDTKNFSALSSTFADDVVANVAPFPIEDLASYEAFLEDDLALSKTQHTTTTVFAYDIETSSAKSISYSDAVYFGQGSALGQTFTYFERFDDVWSKGADGPWKISERTLTIFVSTSKGPIAILFQ